MDYWHIQMHLPQGRDTKTEIDSLKMLQELRPVIGTGEWDDLQCRYFKGEAGGLRTGSIVMVRRGNEPLALVEVTSDYFTDEELEGKYVNHLYRYVKVLDWNKEGITSPLFTQGTLKLLYEISNTPSWNFINNWYQKIIEMEDLKKATDILKFKKQIILQGPPGTGKTKLAKEIAAALAGFSEKRMKIVKIIDKPTIQELLKGASTIKTRNGKDLKIVGIKENVVEVKTDESEIWTPSYNKIIDSYNHRFFDDTGRSGGFIPYEDAIAKFLFDYFKNYNHDISEDLVKLIQFHPSYSYEDFVRGIVAKPNEDGEGVLYKAENKILANIAKAAHQNYLASQQKATEILESKFKKQLEKFSDEVRDSLDKNGEFLLGEDTTARIIAIAEDGFIYSFDKRKEIKYRLLFSDLIKIENHPNQINRSIDIRDIEDSTLKMKGKYPYYYRVYNFINKIDIQPQGGDQKSISLQNYVLIIDEINRANLSSVLGELIYALEYRNEVVESIYETDLDGSKLILPPNLYIIGTMNTADRSVGHIDYAIRRRFAFVDVEPKDLSSEPGIIFHKILFDQVAALFDSNRSQEFEKKDVQLGHSYFIDKTDDGGSMDIRLEFEIKPILREYIKDGILIGEDIKAKVENLQA